MFLEPARRARSFARAAHAVQPCTHGLQRLGGHCRGQEFRQMGTQDLWDVLFLHVTDIREQKLTPKSTQLQLQLRRQCLQFTHVLRVARKAPCRLVCVDRRHQLCSLRLRGQDVAAQFLCLFQKAVHVAPLGFLGRVLAIVDFARVLLLAVVALARVLVVAVVVLVHVRVIGALALARAAILATGLVHNQR